MPSLWVKSALIVLLVASLGLKVRGIEHIDQTEERASGHALVESLSADGFVLGAGGGLEGYAWVATRGDCRIEVTMVSPLGWHQSAMATRAAGQTLAYVYAGHTYAEQPVMLSKLGYYWHKLTNYFYPSAEPPIFGVVMSPGCAAQAIDTAVIARQLS
jgi:hypothetical protein